MMDTNAIRKKVGDTLKKLRRKRGLKADEEERGLKEIGISKKTVERIEKAQNGTMFENVVGLMNLYDAKADDILGLFRSPYKIDVESSYDFTPVHQKKLLKYNNMNYCCLYIGTEDPPKNELDSMLIYTDSDIKEGYLSAKAVHNEYAYSVKIVSPADFNYTFIYFTSSDTLADKGVIILPFIKEIKKKFILGVGVMLSLSMDNSRTPYFQKVLVISRSYLRKVKKCVKNEELTKPLNFEGSNDKMNEFGVKVMDLEKQTIQLYQKCSEALSQSEKAKQ